MAIASFLLVIPNKIARASSFAFSEPRLTLPFAAPNVFNALAIPLSNPLVKTSNPNVLHLMQYFAQMLLFVKSLPQDVKHLQI